MKKMAMRFFSVLLTFCFVLSLLPFMRAEESSAASGTVMYYEDFEYADTADALSVLGWQKSEELNANGTSYSIVGGKLFCDSTGAKVDSYLTVLDDDYMSEIAKSDYSFSYKLKYAYANAYNRYTCFIHNYNGYKSYNAAQIRIAGYGNHQVRTAPAWYIYDSSSTGYYLPWSGTNSVSYKLFGVEAQIGNLEDGEGYPMVGREVTVRVSVDIDAGATVYINDLKVSTTVSTYKELFLATQAYASALGLKTSPGLKAYIDDLTVYTGLGAVPAASKDSVSYKPTSLYDGERLRVLSFNILHEQFDNVALEDGLTRVDHLNNIISGYNPDIVGLQERPATHKDGITTLLTQNSALAVVDEYRTDTPVSGVIVQTPIMYNVNRYELIENTEENYNYAHGSILLAEHYNNRNKTEATLNKYSGTKGLSWAVLRNKQTGTMVLAINSHFALWSSYATYLNYVEKDAAKDRISNAEQVIDTMDKVFSVFGAMPTVFTGDLNMRQTDPGYKELVTRLSDTLYGKEEFLKHPYSMNNGTSNLNNSGFMRDPNLPIDHIFYSAESLVPLYFRMQYDYAEARIASDHYPNFAIYGITKAIAPACSHSTGIYSGTQYVSLEGEGDVYYTTDNSDPRTSSTSQLYTGRIVVAKDTVLKYCTNKNGVYSPVARSSIYFGPPIYVTETIKNPAGTDFFEGFEIVNASAAAVDLSDFIVWSYSSATESVIKNADPLAVTAQMMMARHEGEAILLPGEVGYCTFVMETTYLNKAQISASSSKHLVTVSSDVEKVTYHTDYWAKLIAYNNAGTITADKIFPIDRTTRTTGYTTGGTLATRKDHPDPTAGTVFNYAYGYNFGNATYTRLYLAFNTSHFADEAFCICDMDSTGGGVSTATDGTTTAAEGGFNHLPTDTALMRNGSFKAGTYSIGSLTSAQKTAFDAIRAERSGVSPQPVSNEAEFLAMTADGSYYLTGDISVNTSYASVFTGELSGMGYTVTASVPLFTELAGKVYDMNVEGNIAVSSGNNGAVAPTVSGTVRLDGITVNATLTGGTYTGGLFGLGRTGSSVSIYDCTNNGNHVGTNMAGGMVGYMQGSSIYIEGCTNNGQLQGGNMAGGMVARFGVNATTVSDTCTVINCTNKGDISSPGTLAAGMLGFHIGAVTVKGCLNYGDIGYVGEVADFVAAGITAKGGSTYTSGGATVNTENSLSITDCINYGDITTAGNGGGIVGRTPAVAPATGGCYEIITCSNIGKVTYNETGCAWATKALGGIVGYFYSATGNKVIACFNVGAVTGNMNADSAFGTVGGIVGYVNGKTTAIHSCYNSGTVTGTGNSGVYQLFYNKSTTGGTATYIYNNRALAVTGATYALNGTQADNHVTFTATELKDGTVWNALNEAAGQTYYYQKVNVEPYPVHTDYEMLSPEGIVINAYSDYVENGTALFEVDCFTDMDSFAREFDTAVRAFRDGTEINGTAYVGTGCTVTSYDLKDELVLMVMGDADGDGAATATDCAVLKSCIISYRAPTFTESIVLDLDGNGLLSGTDYLTEVLRAKLGK